MKKDTKWVKEEINKTLRNKIGNGINYYDYLDLTNSLNEIIGQLDKQEDVENLFVPKQKYTEWLKEEVDKALRNKIADVIHHCDYINLKNSLNEIIDQLDEQELPMIPNEVEEEQKYYVVKSEGLDGVHYYFTKFDDEMNGLFTLPNDKKGAYRFDDKEKAQAIANYTGNKVEELEERVRTYSCRNRKN